MILTETVKVKKGTRGTKKYQEMGYVLNEDGYYNVKPIDLSPTSQFRILVQCDTPSCSCTKEITYDCYNKIVSQRGSYKCRTCGNNDARKTMMDKYGYEYPAQSPEIQSKIQNTMMERYNVKNYTQAPDFQDKASQTCIERFGVGNPMQSEEVQKKARLTMQRKYGCDYSLQNAEIHTKMAQSLYQNGNVPSSIQQRYLKALYNGILNFPIKYYHGDIVLKQDKIDIEYSGGGHRLSVITGTMTAEEYKQYEIKRYKTIKAEGYKQIEITSFKDLLPSDEILIAMLTEAKKYFKDYPNHTWINYDIDQGIMRNAENKNGIPYFYGQLRKIRKEEVV